MDTHRKQRVRAEPAPRHGARTAALQAGGEAEHDALATSPRSAAQRQRIAAAFGRAAPIAPTPPVQKMAVSTIKNLQQSGGTCGLYSLGMAMSGVDGLLAGKRDQLLRRLLAAGNEVGTFVGEFMDADNLAAVGKKLGFSASVVDFGDASDMKDKLTATGGAGVVMGYSVFDDSTYQVQFPEHFKDLSAFKHLFSHWSVIESLSSDKLAVRDPNDPGSTRSVEAAAFHQANADASTPSGKFSFGEFEAKRVGGVKGLRTAWEGEELDKRGGGAKAQTPLPTQGQPEVDLKLKGKIVTVSGSMKDESTTAPLPSSAPSDKTV